MERREIIVVTMILLVVILTASVIYYQIRQKILYSPGELLFSPEDLPLDKEFCFDSDDGLNYFQKGNVIWGIGDGNFHDSRDYCFSVDSGGDVWEDGTLFEMYCVGNSFKIKDIKCLGFCENGICS